VKGSRFWILDLGFWIDTIADFDKLLDSELFGEGPLDLLGACVRHELNPYVACRMAGASKAEIIKIIEKGFH